MFLHNLTFLQYLNFYADYEYVKYYNLKMLIYLRKIEIL